MVQTFILLIIFGSALFGGIDIYLPLIDINNDLPLSAVLCLIFTVSVFSLRNLTSFIKNCSIPIFPIILFGITLFSLSLFSPYARLSYLELFKYIGCMLFFYLVWQHCYHNKSKRLNFIVLYVIVIDSIALLNLFSWMLRIPSDTFYGYDPGRGRLFGTMLYCNTAATFLIPAFFIHLAFIIMLPLRKNKFLNCMGAALCMMNVVISMSRGAEIMLCMLYFPLVFFLSKYNRVKIFWVLFVLQNVALLILPSLLNFYYARGVYSLCVMIVLYICAVSFVTVYILPTVIDYVGKMRFSLYFRRHQTCLLSFLIFFGLALPFWKLPQFSPNKTALTEWIVERQGNWSPVFKDGSIQSPDQSVNLRIETVRFAGKMFLDKPWIGFGPGIYPLAYLQYRTFNFPWNSPHALLLEQLINLGIIGFTCFAILVYAFSKRVVFLFYNTKKYLAKVLVFSIIALFGHACIDKDWNYYAMQLNLWLIIGLALTYCTENDKQKVVE